ncbi:MFS transporter [Streptomyces kaniharaensis]|uniref:MFS transporter n=1 Tax=Streptomyces kaniharaensis TaxID=212423 RepID=A0A6N7KH64_9ACTN|nr:MFS transporter [Streptomyces kaniharaensis]MQS10780.1 MFS transporter [Streptomyces kaniharaensis]
MSPARRQRLTLAASITGAVVVALDGTVLTVAQPSLQRDLHASANAVQWTSTGYLIAVAALLVFAGRLGDRYGHRRVFAIGVAGFATASVGIGLAPGIDWVIALRVVQGVAGALLQPATLGMLRAVWPADRIATPIAVRTGAIGLSAAAGPLVGGALTAHLGWRAVFFLTILPAAAAGLLALAVPMPGPGPAEGAAGLDLPGAALLALTLACLVHTLVGLPARGWSPGSMLGLAAAVALGLAFARHEQRAARPLLPPAVLRSPEVAPALGVLLTASAAIFGTLFLATYFLQDVLALDPLQSALRGVPLAVTMVLAAPASAWLTKRQSTRATVLLAMILITAGVLLISRLDRSSGAVEIGAGFLLLGTGFGAVMATATAIVVRGASTADAGVAGGLQQTAMNIGPTLGVALATTVAGHAALGAALAPGALALAAIAALGALLATRLPGGGRTARASKIEAWPRCAMLPFRNPKQ